MGIGYWCDGIDGIVKLIAINSSIPGKIYFVSMMGRPHHGENVGKLRSLESRLWLETNEDSYPWTKRSSCGLLDFGAIPWLHVREFAISG